MRYTPSRFRSRSLWLRKVERYRISAVGVRANFQDFYLCRCGSHSDWSFHRAAVAANVTRAAPCARAAR
ncbi:hypothetical protein EVAR_70566_1 [Eumeta japonica]|uniref:Uncharacterized protein n=1 Tax=Eumeta variegata TaxID=151549 RepID=A0A4C1SVM2_EUMVA|nr:hypothetical protein EVAR_70566_1 [Eumeta japonica]